MRAGLQPPSHCFLWDWAWRDTTWLCEWNATVPGIWELFNPHGSHVCTKAAVSILTCSALLYLWFAAGPGLSPEFMHYLRKAKPGMVETGICWELTTSESALIKGFNGALPVWVEGEGPYSYSWEVQPQGFVFCGVRAWVDVGKHLGFFPCGVLVRVITMYLWCS